MKMTKPDRNIWVLVLYLCGFFVVLGILFAVATVLH